MSIHVCTVILPVFQQQEERCRLSICNKLCYAVGGAPYQITGCALGFFLQIYLLDVAQVGCPGLRPLFRWTVWGKLHQQMGGGNCRV